MNSNIPINQKVIRLQEELILDTSFKERKSLVLNKLYHELDTYLNLLEDDTYIVDIIIKPKYDSYGK